MRPVVALATLAAVFGTGCESDEEQQPSAAGQNCRMPFAEYSAGPSVDGIQFVARSTSCGRRPSVTYIYGTCHATSDTGCAPPLEVQTWSACHRKVSRAPAGHDIELRRGAVTVVIFARSDRLARRAVAALRMARPPDPSLRATRRLRACDER